MMAEWRYQNTELQKICELNNTSVHKFGWLYSWFHTKTKFDKLKAVSLSPPVLLASRMYLFYINEDSSESHSSAIQKYINSQ
jgi:hypothetical protein